MIILSVLSILAIVLAAVNVLSQIIFAVIGIVVRPTIFKSAAYKKYAVVICARDEENVIATLLNSINDQDYDHNKIQIYVVADNCTDKTAEISRSLGAEVLERFNLDLIGKGFALDYFFKYMLDEKKTALYDGFFIFDADNILDKNYIKEMNNAFSSGYDIVTSYRNSSNFSEGWVAACSALWFIRESRLYNNSRQSIGFNCHVGGTGFMFDSKIIENMGGWNYHLITEDLEFSMDTTSKGYKIGYCESAIFYDEQPAQFKTSWKQRTRWAKGFLQVFWHYMPKLLRTSIDTHSASFLDLTFLVMPWMVITFFRIILGFLYAALGFVSWTSQFDSTFVVLMGTVYGSIGLMGLAIATVFVERDRIAVSNVKLALYCAMFPIFILSYVPISFVAIFKKASWKRIAHQGVNKTG